MKTKLLLSIFILLSYRGVCQCALKDFFAFSLGATEFEVKKELTLQQGVVDLNVYKNDWIKAEGDSTNFSTITYSFGTHPCLGGYKNYVHLDFQNQVLYQIVWGALFKSSELKVCLADYSEIKSSMALLFPVKTENKIQNEDKEDTGEGIWLFKNKNEYNNFFSSKEAEFMDVGYEIENEKMWNDRTWKMERTSKIGDCKLELTYSNWKGVKKRRPSNKAAE